MKSLFLFALLLGSTLALAIPDDEEVEEPKMAAPAVSLEEQQDGAVSEADDVSVAKLQEEYEKYLNQRNRFFEVLDAVHRSFGVPQPSQVFPFPPQRAFPFHQLVPFMGRSDDLMFDNAALAVGAHDHPFMFGGIHHPRITRSAAPFLRIFSDYGYPKPKPFDGYEADPFGGVRRTLHREPYLPDYLGPKDAYGLYSIRSKRSAEPFLRIFSDYGYPKPKPFDGYEADPFGGVRRTLHREPYLPDYLGPKDAYGLYSIRSKRSAEPFLRIFSDYGYPKPKPFDGYEADPFGGVRRTLHREPYLPDYLGPKDAYGLYSIRTKRSAEAQMPYPYPYYGGAFYPYPPVYGGGYPFARPGRRFRRPLFGLNTPNLGLYVG